MTPLRLLVVDDHAVVRRGVRALLESQPGWDICGEATDGQEAIRKAAELKPDIVVLDISLPGLNGLEATSRILKESPESEVLILTMHHSEEPRTAGNQGRRAGLCPEIGCGPESRRRGRQAQTASNIFHVACRRVRPVHRGEG